MLNERIGRIQSPKIIRIGGGVAKETAEVLKQLGLSRPLIVTDKNLLELGHVNLVLAILQEKWKVIASEAQVAEMRQNYLAGNYGYGHAKQALYELLVEKYAKQREAYNYYMNNLEEVDAALEKGAEKAREVANGVLNRVREKLGY